MILLYHKVDKEPLTEWWVSADAFERHMVALAGYRVVYLDEYDRDAADHMTITFDGVYENVFRFAFPILRKWGYPFELFVTGDYIGGDNAFDGGEPPARFCTLEQLKEMAAGGGRIQWHTASHRRLSGLAAAELAREIRAPAQLQERFPPPHLQWFAYPHGEHDREAVELVRSGYRGAVSCVVGDDSRYELNRVTALEDMRLDRSRVTVIVANYNYGAYLPEAMDSVLHQSCPPDEILLIDDSSTDGSQDIALRYSDVARVVLNERNLGIVGNFNKAVDLATGDYIAILGADNRMRCDYVERCKVALDRNPEAAVAYTDMTIFGPRAPELARRVGASPIGESQSERWPLYRWEFPEPTPERIERLSHENFMHGSSMYRRAVWSSVGGYLDTSGAEDHNLFRRMLGDGWSAVRVPHALIEYRQHSVVQANTVLGLQLENARLASLAKLTANERDVARGAERAADDAREHAIADRDRALAERDAAFLARDAAIAERNAEAALVHTMRNGLSWRLTKPLRFGMRLASYGLGADDRARLKGLALRAYRALPLPAPMRRRLSRAYGELRRRYPSAETEAAVLAPFAPPGFVPAERIGNLPDYVCWGIIDWRFRHQRPQHLALGLAASGRRVFYVSVHLTDRSVAGFECEPLDGSGRLFQVRLFAADAPSIYATVPSPALTEQLRGGLGRLLLWAGSRSTVSLVQHPFWTPVATVLPNSRVVYDCMDHHEGFGNNAPELMALERSLFASADLTVATSGPLEEILSHHARRLVVIRNACEYEHFAAVPAAAYRDPKGRKIIGYYGAIAEWFDLDLLSAIAKRFPDCAVLLIGADTVNASKALSGLANVSFLGEIPYPDLPGYLHGFDVCVLPFKVVPLTLATNPVKVYEFLSAGKPVVAVDLPEMAQFGGLAEVAGDTESFLGAVERALNQPADPAEIERRHAFAREQTWTHRVQDLVAAAESSAADPWVSVVVVTYNNLELTKACLSSLECLSDYERLEILVVDNASADGSADYLRDWVAQGNHRRLIANPDNKGFAAANNQGLAVAEGDYLILLNNDTHVTPGWIRTLIRHMVADPTVGLIGPVTNNIGNEARIAIAYSDMDGMLRAAADYTLSHLGQTYPLRTAAFFCAAMPRSTYARIGPLDEAFGRGFFEDDDYCRRIEHAGLRVLCAEDVFVHHHLSASFNKLKAEVRRELFERNQAVYEAKWGTWIPHTYRTEDRTEPLEAPAAPNGGPFDGWSLLRGHCCVCGKEARFFYTVQKLQREQLVCEHCRSTSRYRSLARGLLRAVAELTGVEAPSLDALRKRKSPRRLRVYDTQPPFYYEPCAYPLPDLLKRTGWIDVELSQFKPSRPLGETISPGVTNQNLERLTFEDDAFDIVVTSDVMEHVRLDDLAHREILRVLKPGGVYLFTVPHERSLEETLVRVQVNDPADPAQDVHLLPPEYHGDTNSDEGSGVLSYRVYGLDLDRRLETLGFAVDYTRDDRPDSGLMHTELFYCRKGEHGVAPPGKG